MPLLLVVTPAHTAARLNSCGMPRMQHQFVVVASPKQLCAGDTRCCAPASGVACIVRTSRTGVVLCKLTCAPAGAGTACVEEQRCRCSAGMYTWYERAWGSCWGVK
jgi:hypothetical protein